jgi:thioredoxin-like negative regulator of GroEL
MLDANYLCEKFTVGKTYDDYLKTGTDEQRRRWAQVYEIANLNNQQRSLVQTFVRDTRILIISGIWCGDCVQQVPLIWRIAEENTPRIHMRIVDRDEHKDLSDQFKICCGNRVPTVLFLAEDYEFCGLAGDRTLSRYREIAKKQLGASCATGINAPEMSEVQNTQQDWLDEIERVQLMLRLSSRLRSKHGD